MNQVRSYKCKTLQPHKPENKIRVLLWVVDIFGSINMVHTALFYVRIVKTLIWLNLDVINQSKLEIVATQDLTQQALDRTRLVVDKDKPVNLVMCWVWLMFTNWTSRYHSDSLKMSLIMVYYLNGGLSTTFSSSCWPPTRNDTGNLPDTQPGVCRAGIWTV